MHTPTLLPAFVLVLGLASCEKATPPPVVQTPPATVQDDAQLIAARDALARQALEIETRSALLDKQLADMEQKLRQSENDALRGQLDAMKQQNEQLRAQADTARQQSDQLSRRLVATTPPPPPVLPPQSPQRDYSLFYDRLAPHGRWLDVSGYGLCFQPRLSRTTTWRPYVDGCWSWSTLGWTWQSNEPFGWATYHYGRWIHLTRHGWLWVPGCEWAPAWVAWRQSRDYIGWAPLPPEPGPCTSIQRDCDTRYNLGPASYTFISVTNFVRPTYTTICRPVSYNSTIFHHTVNSTQIVPCGGPAQGGTPLFMHHGGPPRHQIEQQCRQTIPQTQLRPVEHTHLTAGDLPEGGRKPGKPHLLPVIDLPTLSSRPSLPDIKPAERIDRPQLADTFAGVPDTARPAIQQTLEADRKRPLIADSPHPAPASPSPQPVLSTPQLTETVRPAQPVEVQNSPASPLEPAQVPPALANLGAPLEKRGGRPHLIAPAAPGEAPNIPTTLPTPAVVEAPAASAMPPVIEKPSLTPPTTPRAHPRRRPHHPHTARPSPSGPMSQPATPPTTPTKRPSLPPPNNKPASKPKLSPCNKSRPSKPPPNNKPASKPKLSPCNKSRPSKPPPNNKPASRPKPSPCSKSRPSKPPPNNKPASKPKPSPCSKSRPSKPPPNNKPASRPKPSPCSKSRPKKPPLVPPPKSKCARLKSKPSAKPKWKLNAKQKKPSVVPKKKPCAKPKWRHNARPRKPSVVLKKRHSAKPRWRRSVRPKWKPSVRQKKPLAAPKKRPSVRRRWKRNAKPKWKRNVRLKKPLAAPQKRPNAKPRPLPVPPPRPPPARTHRSKSNAPQSGIIFATASWSAPDLRRFRVSPGPAKSSRGLEHSKTLSRLVASRSEDCLSLQLLHHRTVSGEQEQRGESDTKCD
ncbi:MAG: DUF6600 domain-containing protein [Verrucomicrobiaceae bacterium]